jgi:hypothetical protein
MSEEYSKAEMRLLVKNQKESEPKEPVIPDKEEAKSPFCDEEGGNRVETTLLQERKIRGAQTKNICDCKGTVYPEYEEQS